MFCSPARPTFTFPPHSVLGGNVLAGSDQLPGLPAFIEEPLAAGVEHADGAIRAQDAFVPFEGRATDDGLVDHISDRLAVFGVNALEIVLKRGLKGSGLQAEDAEKFFCPTHGVSLWQPFKATEVRDLLGISELSFAHAEFIVPFLFENRDSRGVRDDTDLHPVLPIRSSRSAEIHGEGSEHPMRLVEDGR